jgi:hypothetical protein
LGLCAILWLKDAYEGVCLRQPVELRGGLDVCFSPFNKVRPGPVGGLKVFSGWLDRATAAIFVSHVSSHWYIPILAECFWVKNKK